MEQETKPVDTTAINDAIREAAKKWVGTLSEVPHRLFSKLYNFRDEIREITPHDDEDQNFSPPLWGTLWAFKNEPDNKWIKEEGGLEAMARCGFRIFEQEDYGYIFGIDGAGYDFYKAHWIPLYMAYLDRQ